MSHPKPLPPTHRTTLLVGALLAVLAALFGWHSWRAEKADQILRLRTVAELTEKATDRYFQQKQLALGELAQDVLAGPGLADLARVQQLMVGFKARHAELVSVNLLRLDGQMLATSLGPSLTNLPSLAGQRDYALIVAALKPESPMELGRPIVGPVSKRWMLPLRYTLYDAAGAPLAFLVAAVQAEMLQSFWRDAPVVQHAAVGLLRDDGYLISRYPLPARARYEDVYGKPRDGAVFRHLAAERFPLRGTVEGVPSLVGESAVSVFARLEHYPVTLVVGTPLSQLHAAWWERTKGPFLLTLLLVTVGLLSLHRLRRRELDWTVERTEGQARLQAEQALRRQAEEHARAQETLLLERGAMLDVLAHEVRQPLHNASAALQSASAELAAAGGQGAVSRLARAHAVLSQVTGSIDNTLAAATLLARPDPIRLEDTDIDTLVALSVGDLPAEQRERVVVQRETALRTVRADMSLVRLALRNLLVNALRHGSPDAPVRLRLDDSDEPLALLIDVANDGAPIADMLRPRLFQRGARGSGSPGHGLGLFIVRRVMELHGGRVELRPDNPEQVVFRLVFEQAGAD